MFLTNKKTITSYVVKDLLVSVQNAPLAIDLNENHTKANKNQASLKIDKVALKEATVDKTSEGT